MSQAKKRLIQRFKELQEFENNRRKKINHDDSSDHDDLTQCNPDSANKTSVTSASLLKTLPNALLLEESILVKPKEKQKSKEVVEDIDEPKPQNVWEALEKLKKENESESLENLSETAPVENVCNNCQSVGSLIEDTHASTIVCRECGIVAEALLDHGPEWRQYNNDDNRGDGVGRCGCPSNFFFPKSSQGTIMVGPGNSRLKRKQKWNSMVYRERSLNHVFEDINEICSKNNIPRIIVDSARSLYKTLTDCKHKDGINAGKQIIIRGENRVSIIAACVCKACEINKNPRSIKEIADFFGLDEKKVTRGIKQFEKIMLNVDDNTIDQLNINTAEDYIRRHCSKLKISKNNTELAVRISNNCCKMKLASDHNPQSIAAGSILLMVNCADLNIDKKTISKMFGTSDVTIGKIYNKISPYADALVDDDATNHLVKKFRING